MEKINLLDLITKELENNNFTNLEQIKKIITYLLKRDITSLFESVEFTTDIIEVDKIYFHNNKIKIKITINNDTYILEALKDKQIITLKNVCENISNGFTIDIKDSITNTLKVNSEFETITETININMSEPYFTYQKKSLNNDLEETIIKPHRLIPINQKYNFGDLFMLEKEENEEISYTKNRLLNKYLNLIDKLKNRGVIVNISTSNKIIDLYDYLPEIFSNLETLADKDRIVRKRI